MKKANFITLIKENKYHLIVILTSSLLVSYLHQTTPAHVSTLHLVHYYMFYLIVIYVAYIFGFLGGLISAFVLSILYEARVYFHILHGDIPHYLIRAVVEIIMMYAVGIIAGYFSSKLKREKQKLEEVSEELKNSYRLLEQNMLEKIAMEKQLAKDDRLRVLGQLSAGIAHEVRNPLAAIKSGAGILKKDKNNDQILNIIQSEIDKLNSFIDRFLQYVRFGKNESICFPVKLFFEELEEFTRLLCKDKLHIDLQFSYLPIDEYYINGDKNSLKHAIVNLLANSIDAVGKSEGFVSLEVDYNEPNIIFSITDNGYGILQEQIEKLFEPFYTTKVDGTGLGLSISAKIIADHGGTIQVKNDGQTCFSIMIPGES